MSCLGTLAELLTVKDGVHASFLFCPKFMAKTQCPVQQKALFGKFTISSLNDFVSDDKEGMFLCMVQSLRPSQTFVLTIIGKCSSQRKLFLSGYRR